MTTAAQLGPTLSKPENPAYKGRTLRRLGVLGMLAAPMMFVEMAVGVAQHGFEKFGDHVTQAGDPFRAATGLLYLVGWACSLVGMRLLRVTGSGKGSRVLFVAQMALLTLAAIWTVCWVAQVGQGTLLYFLGDGAWPISHMLMLVAGIAVLRARVWHGWRRWPCFICAAALPAFGISSVLLGKYSWPSFGLFTMAGFFMLACAVASSERLA